MIVIEITDLAFAVDSIPAIFAITRDPFIVYTSNICAILGLRSLYFLLAGLMNRFIYLRTGLALVLGFVGLKMITADYLPLPRVISLGIIGLIEILTFPFPIWHDSYQPLLPSDIPYIHAGYAEFPPEVGNESKYPYVRDTHHDFN